jgi:hypothetical protein
VELVAEWKGNGAPVVDGDDGAGEEEEAEAPASANRSGVEAICFSMH